MSDKNRTPVTVLGVQIGTSTGWDGIDTFDFVLYDFEPLEGVNLPSGTLGVDYDNGKFYQHDDDGKRIFESSILKHMRDVS